MNLSIQIPTGSHVKAKAGEITDFKTPLFEIASDAEHVIPLAQKLSVSPSKIFHHLKKFVGEEVKKGDLLAINKGLFSTKRVISDYGGKIQEIDHTEGTIIITIKGKKNTVYSPIIGEVVEIRNKEINIKIKKSSTAHHQELINKVKNEYGNEASQISQIDGLSMEFNFPQNEASEEWWFNLRPSNTEPLLRLNIEAINKKILDFNLKKILSLLKI